MHILQTEVSHLLRTDCRGRKLGVVTFHSHSQSISVECNVDHAPTTTLREYLMDEALRQLGRMPEFRLNPRKITFAPQAWATSASMAA